MRVLDRRVLGMLKRAVDLRDEDDDDDDDN
jgi:hypothetical protein